MAKILVVDDEMKTCKYLARRLTDAGHEVRVTFSGDAAIDGGHLFRPDVLVADWNLGSDYDGLEVAEAVQHVHRTVKVILFTAHPPGKLMGRIRQIPLYALVTKPFTLYDICQLVARAVADDDTRPGGSEA